MSISWEERLRRKAAAAEGKERDRVRSGFLAVIALGKSPSAAAASVGKDRLFFTEWREQDQAFAKAWDSAYEQGTDFIEDQALSGALLGHKEPIMARGQKVGDKQIPNTLLILAILNARRPDKYKRSSNPGPGPKGKATDDASTDARRERLLSKIRSIGGKASKPVKGK